MVQETLQEDWFDDIVQTWACFYDTKHYPALWSHSISNADLLYSDIQQVWARNRGSYRN